ncbi:MAG: hypothetical protein ABI846_11350 [Rudaea sp.]
MFYDTAIICALRQEIIALNIALSGGRFDFPGAVSRTQVGTADSTFNNCNPVTMTYSISSSVDAGNSGSMNLSRGAGEPASCAF